jgi:hypothetical protein
MEPPPPTVPKRRRGKGSRVTCKVKTALLLEWYYKSNSSCRPRGRKCASHSLKRTKAVLRWESSTGGVKQLHQVCGRHVKRQRIPDIFQGTSCVDASTSRAEQRVCQFLSLFFSYLKQLLRVSSRTTKNNYARDGSGHM